MNRFSRIIAAFGVAAFALVPLAIAAPDGVIRNSVAVCDPSAPMNCLRPNSDGSLATTGGTGNGNGGGGGTVNTATVPGSPPPAGVASNPFLNGFLDGSGNVRTVAPANPLPMLDSAAVAGIGAPSDAATASGANSTIVGALRAIRDRILGTLTVTEAPLEAATGTTADAATASGANSTIIGALRAIRDRVLGTLTVDASGSQLNTRITAASATGGLTAPYRLVSSAASTNAANIKTTVARVFKVYGCNTTTSDKFVRLFNKASAPVPGTDTPVWSRVLPRSATAGVPLCQSFDAADIGYSFSTGLGVDITGVSSDNDATAIAIGDVIQFTVEYQ